MWKKSNEPGQPILEVTHYMKHLILDFFVSGMAPNHIYTFVDYVV